MPLVARIVFFCLLVPSIQVNASHLAGGELQIRHVKDDQHRISLILFFDEINGSPGAKDQSATARIFRESDGVFIMDVVMFLEGETRLSFSQVDCKTNGLSTLRLSYSKIVDLPSATFGDAQGYYVVWERCCRNYNITNIFSENPQIGGARAAGQTFFLHFPAVVEGGKSFVNSSPVFTTPTSDYFCTNRINTMNFSASDADGDSLVYSMTAPLSTHDLGISVPTPRPKPYPEVLWRPSFSLTNIMGTGSELKINKSGILTAKPTVQGIFAFAVKCEEFRNGKKIGEVRREYQLLVTNDCPPVGIAPVMVAKTLDGQYSDNALSVNFF